MQKIIFVILQKEDNRQKFSLGRSVAPFPWQEPPGPIGNHPLLPILHLGEDSSNGTRVGAKVSVEDKRLAMEPGVRQDGSTHQLVLHGAEGWDSSGVLWQVRNPVMLVLSGVLNERCGEGGVIFDEAPVVPALSPDKARRVFRVSEISQSLMTDV